MQPYISAANNACWALGLLATALPGEAVAPLVASAAERMLHVLKAAGGSVQRRLRENAAISVGRLATVQPSALAVHLSHFLGDWCVTLATITVRVLRPHGPLNPALVPVKILTSFSCYFSNLGVNIVQCIVQSTCMAWLSLDPFGGMYTRR